MSKKNKKCCLDQSQFAPIILNVKDTFEDDSVETFSYNVSNFQGMEDYKTKINSIFEDYEAQIEEAKIKNVPLIEVLTTDDDGNEHSITFDLSIPDQRKHYIVLVNRHDAKYKNEIKTLHSRVFELETELDAAQGALEATINEQAPDNCELLLASFAAAHDAKTPREASAALLETWEKHLCALYVSDETKREFLDSLTEFAEGAASHALRQD